MKNRPNVTVKIMLRYKEEVLMIKHKDGNFGFPGGHVEWNESLIGALKRELREELNYNLKKDPMLFDVWNYIPKENPGRNRIGHTVFLNYIYRLDKKPVLSSPEKLGIFWLTRRDIFSKGIIKNKQFLDKVFKSLKIVSLS